MVKSYQNRCKILVRSWYVRSCDALGRSEAVGECARLEASQCVVLAQREGAQQPHQGKEANAHKGREYS